AAVSSNSTCANCKGSRRTSHPSSVTGANGWEKALVCISAPALAALAHGGQTLHQGQVLFVFQQGTGHRGQAFIQLVQGIGRNVVGQQQTQPVQEFRGRRLFLQAGNFSQGKE